jgi:hypothetical protein
MTEGIGAEDPSHTLLFLTTALALPPLFVLALSTWALPTVWRLQAAALVGPGLLGVACMILRSTAALDLLGVTAALGGPLSMSAGTGLTKRWQAPGATLQYTAWKLSPGGRMQLPLALAMEPATPGVDVPLCVFCLSVEPTLRVKFLDVQSHGESGLAAQARIESE